MAVPNKLSGRRLYDDERRDVCIGDGSKASQGLKMTQLSRTGVLDETLRVGGTAVLARERDSGKGQRGEAGQGTVQWDLRQGR